jgi:hypothetical protein
VPLLSRGPLVAYTSKHTSAGAEVSPNYLRGPWQKDSNCSKPTWSGAAWSQTFPRSAANSSQPSPRDCVVPVPNESRSVAVSSEKVG